MILVDKAISKYSIAILTTILVSACLSQKMRIDSVKIPIDKPSRAGLFLESGIKKENKGEYFSRIGKYTKEINKNPSDYSAFLNRGIAKYMLENYVGAIFDLNQAILINTKLTPAYKYRISISKKLRDFKSACLDSRKLYELSIKGSSKLVNENCL